MGLVKRLKNKEEEAVIEMMDLYGDSLLRTAILMVKDLHLAEEIVQDTFVTAYQKIDQLFEEQKLKSWLIMITMNGCRARMRKWSWKYIFVHRENEHENFILDESELPPEDAILLKWRDQQLHEAIVQLPYKYREVVTLFYFQELTIKVIADLIKENENTVKTRLSRGRILLKEMIKEGGDEHAI